MKVCGSVILTVHGREMRFTEKELITILEMHFPKAPTKYAVTPNIANAISENEWFDVKPLEIDQSLFLEKRNDKFQEMTRQMILEAFDELRRRPELYGKKFKTMFPKKTWSFKTVSQLKALACKLGDNNADWVEQALEWAQRICNGESWESICNNPDTAKWYRLVIWKNGLAKLIGGSCNVAYPTSASTVNGNSFQSSVRISSAVPLVVRY